MDDRHKFGKKTLLYLFTKLEKNSVRHFDLFTNRGKSGPMACACPIGRRQPPALSHQTHAFLSSNPRHNKTAEHTGTRSQTYLLLPSELANIIQAFCFSSFQGVAFLYVPSARSVLQLICEARKRRGREARHRIFNQTKNAGWEYRGGKEGRHRTKSLLPCVPCV